MKKKIFTLFSLCLSLVAQTQELKPVDTRSCAKLSSTIRAIEESAVFTITKTMMDSDSNNLIFGGSPVAFLTSGTINAGNGTEIDPAGDGWLRLTTDSRYQRGYAIIDQSFPSTLGVRIDFEFKTWRTDPSNQGADGFSVFLFDAGTEIFKIGGFGGSLGYAQFNNVGAETSEGLSNGYVGIGLDEFGNFSKGRTEDNLDEYQTEGRIGGSGFNANSLGVRGSAPEYRWLTGNIDLKFKLSCEDANRSTRPTDDFYYRRIQIDFTPGKGVSNNQYSIKASIKTSKKGAFESVLNEYILPSIPPEMLKLGFAASTGDCVNYHEIRNLTITNIVDVAQSLNKPLKKAILKVSPNPFTEEIAIDLPSDEIIKKTEVYNLLGECIYQTIESKTSLKINGMDPVYFIKIKTSSGNVYNTMVIRKK